MAFDKPINTARIKIESMTPPKMDNFGKMVFSVTCAGQTYYAKSDPINQAWKVGDTVSIRYYDNVSPRTGRVYHNVLSDVPRNFQQTTPAQLNLGNELTEIHKKLDDILDLVTKMALPDLEPPR